MKGFKISAKIFLNHNISDVWNTLSSKNALELFHPFCLQNDVIEYEKKDKLIYINGLTYIREFTAWKPNQGFELNIGRENGKKSKVIWEIKDKDEGCIVKISIFPYRTNKIPVFFYPLVSFFLIRPKLKQYLQSVLKGLKYYLYHKVKVEKNQFGKHSWFS